MKNFSVPSRAAHRWCWPLLLALVFVAPAVAGEGDNFNDNVKSTTRWGGDVIGGNGVLTERSQRLEYTCASPTLGEDSSDRLWKLTRFPYNANWEIIIDTHNLTTPTPPLQVNSFGINLLTPDPNNGIYAELYSSALGGGSARLGFAAGVDTGGTYIGGADSTDAASTRHGAVRMAFDSATKIITVHYDTNSTDGYQWVQFGEVGIAGAGGTNVTTDWQLTDADQFTAYIFGYSAGMAVAAGQIYGDNFQQNGGVASSGGATPVPTGNFGFRFPTNNPLITKIISLAGNYAGTIPVGQPRAYNVDVAQDESGKLAGMGTIEGVVTSRGSNVLALPLGSTATVNQEPVARLKTGFAGTVDGIPVAVKGTANVPLEITDIGDGTNGLAATVSGSAKVAGVPYRFKNEPFAAPVGEGAESRLQKEWSLQLDLSNKVIKNKERTVATAQLLLPNGDTISYRERIVRYSATRGYTLSFTRGTNITVVPNRTDRRSSIVIRGLTFVPDGAGWEPTGGTITYTFLGQRGTASLLDFVEP